jgi:hypothetical protein
MRNVAVAVARQLGFAGKVVAEVMSLSENYVATLRQRENGNACGVQNSATGVDLGFYAVLLDLDFNDPAIPGSPAGVECPGGGLGVN